MRHDTKIDHQNHGSASGRTKTGAPFWIIQGLLALVFLFAGGSKLVLPIEALTKEMAFPPLFLRFIGVAEVAGALGLILPGLLRIRRGLTPLAAAGLVIIMVGATAVTVAGGKIAAAILPAVVGVLLVLVARRHWHLVPRGQSPAASTLRQGA